MEQRGLHVIFWRDHFTRIKQSKSVSYRLRTTIGTVQIVRLGGIKVGSISTCRASISVCQKLPFFFRIWPREFTPELQSHWSEWITITAEQAVHLVKSQESLFGEFGTLESAVARPLFLVSTRNTSEEVSCDSCGTIYFCQHLICVCLNRNLPFQRVVINERSSPDAVVRQGKGSIRRGCHYDVSRLVSFWRVLLFMVVGHAACYKTLI